MSGTEVLNIGSRPRWLVAASLISHPSSGRMLERPNSPNSGEDRDVVDVILLCSNNEIKAGLPVSPSPDFCPALCADDRGSGLYFFQIGSVCCSLRQADSTSSEQVCSMAYMASCPSPDIHGYFRVLQPWPFARYSVTEITVAVLTPTCCSLPLRTYRKTAIQFYLIHTIHTLSHSVFNPF